MVVLPTVEVFSYVCCYYFFGVLRASIFSLIYSRIEYIVVFTNIFILIDDNTVSFAPHHIIYSMHRSGARDVTSTAHFCCSGSLHQPPCIYGCVAGCGRAASHASCIQPGVHWLYVRYDAMISHHAS